MTDGIGGLGAGTAHRPILLKALLRERRWDNYRRFRKEYEKAARRIDQELVGTCPTDSTLRRWLRGGIDGIPRSEACVVLEEMFLDYSVERLFEPCDDHHVQDPLAVEIAALDDRKVPSPVGIPSISGQAFRTSEADSWEEDDMRRRALLGVVGGTIMGGVLSAAGSVRRQVDAALPPIPPTDHDVSEWDSVAHDYARAVARVPGDQVLPELLADLDEVRQLTEAANERQRPRLLGIVAELSGLGAISLVGAGNWSESDRYFRTAQRAARASEDLDLYCRISGRRAIYGVYRPGSQISTLNHVDHVLSMGGAKATAGVASAHAARAQFFALRRHRSSALDALRDLEAAFDRLDDAVRSDFESEWGWTNHRLLRVQSFVHSYTGNVRQAAVAQDAVLTLYPASTSLGAAQVKLHQAMCMIASGDPSQGARHAVNVLESLDPGRVMQNSPM